nr:alpha/beta hydrolase [Microbacterium sp.]
MTAALRVSELIDSLRNRGKAPQDATYGGRTVDRPVDPAGAETQRLLSTRDQCREVFAIGVVDANPHNIALEPAAQEFVEATSTPPFLYQLPPEEGRKTVDQVQDEEISKPEIDEEWITVEGGPTGSVPTRIVRPKGAAGILPVVLYTHGAGWVFGDAHTHDRLVRDLAVGTGAAVVFPEYVRAPEAKYPSQNEQSYAVAQWIVQHGAEHNLDPERVVISGDSVGGNMAIALNLMGHERGDVTFRAAALFYPVTNAAFDTESYETFAEGYFLARDGMKWFWDQYTTDESERAEITASPLRATEEQLAFFPPTLIITAEADVLRDEGEAFAAKLRRAGVEVTQVRYGGIIHDFVMVNSLHDTPQAKAAVAQAVAHLQAALDA